ncbi:MAG: putative histone deacetylase superfamily, partial [Nitrososphaeraceae archaeon]|nr:putative histone deacetylase superfamily [Nitrososphaeraceae archaeon]
MCLTAVLFGDQLSKYGFGRLHPWNNERIYDFWSKFQQMGLDKSPASLIEEPELALEESILSFHDKDYVNLVKKAGENGNGYLDTGDTPAFRGIFEASSYVVGSTLKALDVVIRKKNGIEHAFNPIGGLHHSKRTTAAGFCVFNDIGIAILESRRKYGIKKIAYIDIDAHHGDGVYYEFEDDPLLYIADIHEDGKFLYPGTGSEWETGKGDAVGTKLNISLYPDSTDKDFIASFKRVEEFVDTIAKPELIILQSGADSLKHDPLTHLNLTHNSHNYVARKLHSLAHKHSNGRIVALGGGGYNKINIGDAWTSVIK